MTAATVSEKSCIQSFGFKVEFHRIIGSNQGCVCRLFAFVGVFIIFCCARSIGSFITHTVDLIITAEDSPLLSR